MTNIFIALGSNIEPEYHLQKALELLEQDHDIQILKKSSIYKSNAVGFEGSYFLNQVLEIHTDLNPEKLKERLTKLESVYSHLEHTGQSRTLDIDLLLYKDIISFSRALELPSDDILKYSFVLKPLAEIAGDNVHPLLRRTYKELWEHFYQAITPLSLLV